MPWHTIWRLEGLLLQSSEVKLHFPESLVPCWNHLSSSMMLAEMRVKVRTLGRVQVIFIGMCEGDIILFICYKRRRLRRCEATDVSRVTKMEIFQDSNQLENWKNRLASDQGNFINHIYIFELSRFAVCPDYFILLIFQTSEF